MPWPIPKLVKIEQPKPISWRAWLPTLFVVGSAAVGAVLLLWPRGRSTNTLEFWVWLAGLPIVACCLMLGLLFDRWESKKVQAEEEEKEQERISSLWQEWCRRHLRVSTAVAITPVPTASLNGANGKLPVNKGRAKGLAWKSSNNVNEQYKNVLSELTQRLRGALARRREMAVVLLHGDIPAQIGRFESELKSSLEEAAPGVRFTVTREPVTECARWIAKQIDERNDTAKLIVAVQVWPEGESAHTFSEGLAAVLLESKESSRRGWLADGATAHPDGSEASCVLRPMLSALDRLEADVTQMVNMQTASRQPTHFWHTGCDDELSSAIQSAVKADPKNPVIERSFDHIIGLRGPATSWIMLATALEAAAPSPRLQLLAWHNDLDQQLNLCIIAPAERKHDSEGTRSDS